MGLLADAADWFKSRRTRIRRWHEDEVGRFAFEVRVSGDPFIVVAKRYLASDDDGNRVASFDHDAVVERARDRGLGILLFVQHTDDRLVFNPETVRSYGKTRAASDTTRASRGEIWTDVDADLSCSFEDWADGVDTPPAPSDVADTTLADYSDVGSDR